MSLFNTITLNNNAYVAFVKQLFNASQIEFLLHALQVRLKACLISSSSLNLVLVLQVVVMNIGLE